MELLKVMRVQWDRAGAVAAILVGVGFLIFGYVGVSGTGYVAKQMPFIISGGLGGIFLLGIGAMLWLSADLRDEWRELRGLRMAYAPPQYASPQYAPPQTTPAARG